MKRALLFIPVVIVLAAVLWVLLGERAGIPVPDLSVLRARLGLGTPSRTPLDAVLVGQDGATPAPDNGPFKGTGILQAADDVVVSAEMAGRVTFLGAKLGETVEAGATIIKLDEEMILAQIEQSQTATQAAEANLASVRASIRQQDVDATGAAVAAAAGQVSAAQVAVQAAEANVEAANARVKAAQARYNKLAAGATAKELELANKQIELAKVSLWAAQAARDAAKNGLSMVLRIPIVIEGVDLGTFEMLNPVGPKSSDVDSAEARIVDANSALALAEAQLQKLKGGAGREELAVAQAVIGQAQADAAAAGLLVEQAQQAVAVAEAQEAQAEAAQQVPLAGPRAEDIAIAEAKIAEAQAQVAILETTRARLTLTTPIGGVVTEQLVHEGEVVLPGARLIIVSALDPVVLTVYVPESRLAQVRLGQRVTVTTNSHPGQSFEGEVAQIAGEAEFTPRSAQTEAERAATVFAVQIRVPNPDRKLRPGMPASAVFN